jgi:hypothetical protein
MKKVAQKHRNLFFALAALSFVLTSTITVKAAVSSSASAIMMQPRPISASGECARVCGDIRARMKTSAKQVEAETDLWRQRLGVKSDVITYPQGFSAAEELLKFMSNHYPSRAPGNQAEPQFLAYLMAKCFPETYVDLDRASLNGLVGTMWSAKNLKIEKEISSCR